MHFVKEIHFWKNNNGRDTCSYWRRKGINTDWTVFCVSLSLGSLVVCFFLICLFFNWRIIALQNFVVFCQTSMWISHRYTYGLVLVAKLCPTLGTPWTVACQTPLSMGFSRQEYWSGLPFPSSRYTYIPSLWTSLPIPLLYVDIEPPFEFPETYSKFLLAIYFTYGNS